MGRVADLLTTEERKSFARLEQGRHPSRCLQELIG